MAAFSHRMLILVMATLDPLKSFGPSAFGPLRFRAVDGNLKGDWQPLATLVRLPVTEGSALSR